MTDNTLNLDALTEAFKADCKVIRLKYEYAAQTSKKIRAVWKNKAANGKRVSSSVPFGYVKNPQDKGDWLVDEPAADIVRKIYALCLDGRGPLQIAKQLEQEKVLIPSAYYASLGRKTRKQYTHPYAWDQKTVAGILANQQYTVL